MSDDESAYSDDARKKKGAANPFKERQQKQMTELDETLAEYISEWRKQRQKELDALASLKEKQAKRRIQRAEEEKKLLEQKKLEDERKQKEEAEAKAKEAERKRLEMEEAEKKRQEAASKKSGGEKKKGGGDKMAYVPAAMGEKGKSKEQLAEEKRVALAVRVPH